MPTLRDLKEDFWLSLLRHLCKNHSDSFQVSYTSRIIWHHIYVVVSYWWINHSSRIRMHFFHCQQSRCVSISNCDDYLRPTKEVLGKRFCWQKKGTVHISLSRLLFAKKSHQSRERVIFSLAEIYSSAVFVFSSSSATHITYTPLFRMWIHGDANV